MGKIKMTEFQLAITQTKAVFNMTGSYHHLDCILNIVKNYLADVSSVSPLLEQKKGALTND